MFSNSVGYVDFFTHMTWLTWNSVTVTGWNDLDVLQWSIILMMNMDVASYIIIAQSCTTMYSNVGYAINLLR